MGPQTFWSGACTDLDLHHGLLITSDKKERLINIHSLSKRLTPAKPTQAKRDKPSQASSQIIGENLRVPAEFAVTWRKAGGEGSGWKILLFRAWQPIWAHSAKSNPNEGKPNSVPGLLGFGLSQGLPLATGHSTEKPRPCRCQYSSSEPSRATRPRQHEKYALKGRAIAVSNTVELLDDSLSH